jgi:hypothetical protein
MATPNLALSHVEQSQDRKEVTMNVAMDGLDKALNSTVSFATADADLTLTVNQFASGMVLAFTGALTADRFVNLPAAINRLFCIKNATTGVHAIKVRVIGGEGGVVSVLATDGLVLAYSDGANVVGVAFGSSTGGAGGAGGGGGTGGSGFANAITPVGVIDGSNAVFTLPQPPNPPESLQLFRNGRLMMPGAVDFTLSADTITYNSGNVPQAGATPDVHICFYRF